MVMALLASLALAETRRETYLGKEDGWNYIDTYEDEVLTQRERAQAQKDGSTCTEYYSLVCNELTLVQKILKDTEGNRLAGSVYYSYDYDTGEYYGYMKYMGTDEEGRDLYEEYDSEGSYSAKHYNWTSEDGTSCQEYYDTEGKVR